MFDPFFITPEQHFRLENIALEHSQGLDPAHDILHVRRVAALATQIGAREGAMLGVVVPAALLHELFCYPKNHPKSALSGEVCAEEAARVLAEERFAPEHIEAICACIRIHGFSRGITPTVLEAQVLQDADRLDAIGAIGIARCFATGTTMGRPFYDRDDPFCRNRPPDDAQWTLDHFYRKLLRIPASLHTPTARVLATERMAFLEAFLAQMAREIAPSDSKAP